MLGIKKGIVKFYTRFLELLEITTVSTPPSGRVRLYFASDKRFHIKDEDGNDERLIGESTYQQVVSVENPEGNYTTIQAAIDSISDAASDKIYTVFVYPGEYDEAVNLKTYVDIVAIDPEATRILQQVTDNNVECHCNLRITITSASGNGLNIQHANSIIIHEGNISSSVAIAVLLTDGSLKIRNGIVECSLNTNVGHGISVASNNLTLHNTIILCTHADAKSIYAAGAQNAYCMNVWANRNDDANITQKITGGFNVDSDVQ